MKIVENLKKVYNNHQANKIVNHFSKQLQKNYYRDHNKPFAGWYTQSLKQKTSDIMENYECEPEVALGVARFITKGNNLYTISGVRGLETQLDNFNEELTDIVEQLVLVSDLNTVEEYVSLRRDIGEIIAKEIGLEEKTVRDLDEKYLDWLIHTSWINQKFRD